jgi:hypothetical protein
MTKNSVMKNIRTTCMFFLSGILGIIAFFNTAAIEQAVLLEIGEDEMMYLVDGINRSSFYLLLICIFFLIALLPIEEIVSSFLMKQTNKTTEINDGLKKLDIYQMIAAGSFSLGFVSFSIVFIIYVIRFIPLI